MGHLHHLRATSDDVGFHSCMMEFSKWLNPAHISRHPNSKEHVGFSVCMYVDKQIAHDVARPDVGTAMMVVRDTCVILSWISHACNSLMCDLP